HTLSLHDALPILNYIVFTDRFFKMAYPAWMDTVQPALVAEYRRHVIEDPMVLVRNVVEKVRLLHLYLTDASITGAFPYDVIYPLGPAQRAMYRATIAGVLVLAVLGAFSRFRWVWGPLLAMLALLAVSLLPPLVVSPGYLLGFLGAMYASCFAWFGACATGLIIDGGLRPATHRRATRAAALFAASV